MHSLDVTGLGLLTCWQEIVYYSGNAGVPSFPTLAYHLKKKENRESLK